MKPIDRPFVFVRWTDACTRHGWASAEDATEGVELVWSSGHMLERNAREVKLASDVGMDNYDINRRIAVPLGMIEEIRKDSMTGELLYRKKSRTKQKVRNLGTGESNAEQVESVGGIPKGSEKVAG